MVRSGVEILSMNVWRNEGARQATIHSLCGSSNSVGARDHLVAAPIELSRFERCAITVDAPFPVLGVDSTAPDSSAILPALVGPRLSVLM